MTQVTVDPYDDAFHEPVKIIGRTLTEEEAFQEEKKGNYVTKTEQGYRRIVAAPKPDKIIEIDAIRTLLLPDRLSLLLEAAEFPVLEQNEKRPVQVQSLKKTSSAKDLLMSWTQISS